MDYSQHASASRFYIIDRQTGQITATKAAHGSGSDPNNTGYATQFSNTLGSKQSSLGAFITQPYYSQSMGKPALRLVGQQAGINNNTDRGLAIHSSDYVNQSQCGRSEGCMSMSNEAYNQFSQQLSGAFIYGHK
jgi:hypothetical protein